MSPSATNEAQSAVVPATKSAKAKEEAMSALRAISQGEVMPGIPTFPTFAAERRHILVHMAATFRNWARSGYSEGQAGHISVRDPEFPGVMWMNSMGRHYGMLRAGDMVAVEIATGAIVAGRPNPATGRVTSNAAGYHIHSAVHRRRADVHAVCHCHTAGGRAWSVFARPLDMLTQDVCNFYGAHAVYGNYGGIVFAADEGNNIAAALGDGNKGLILMNHGLLTVGSTVDEAGYMFGLLERSCAIQLQVEAALAGNPGLKKNVISDDEAAHAFKMASEKNALYREFQPEVELEIEAAGGEGALAEGFEDLVINVDKPIA